MPDLDRDFPFADLARVHALLGYPTRLAMIRELASGPKAGFELAEAADLSQSAVSQHMAKLKEAGLVLAARKPEHRQVIVFRLAEPQHPLVAATIALLKNNR